MQGQGGLGIAAGKNTGGEGSSILARSPLGTLDETSRNALLELGRVEPLPRRTRITQQEEPIRSFFILGAGRVKLERTRPGHSFPLGHRGPGDVVGEGVFARPVAGENAVVVDESVALVLPAQALVSLVDRDPALKMAFFGVLLGIQRATEERLASLLLRDVRARLAAFLLDAEGRWGEACPSGVLITASFTHSDIASLIGSTRETVTLELGKFRRDGLISLDKRRVILRDRDALARCAALS